MEILKIKDLAQLNNYNKNYIIIENDSILTEYIDDLCNVLKIKFKLKIELVTYNNLIKNLIKKNDKINIITINPIKYNQLIKNKFNNVFLYIISVEENFSNIRNLSKYISSNNIKDIKKLIFKISLFKKFLFESYPKKEILGFFNKILSFLNLNLKKKYIYKNLWIPILVINDLAYKGFYVGLGKYNYFYKKNKEYIDKYNFIISKLADEHSKHVFKISNFGKPRSVWKYYFENLISYPHYTEFMPQKKNSVILNLGVANGFEIPYFLNKNIIKLINVDPTGEKLLHPYVKIFCQLNKKKINFNKKYLYESDKIYIKSNEGKTTISELIDEYNLNRLDMIKSDIEGFEINLVNEIEHITERFRPILALSIYHRNPIKDQIVEIPFKLMSKLKDYKFFIRHYTYNKWDTLIYCCPIK